MVPAGSAQVRAEDCFDVEAVTVWLRKNAADGRSIDGPPEVRQFTGGASNLTFLLSYEAHDPLARRDLILRRPPGGTKARGAHDMGREFGIQRALAPVFPLVPTMVAHCADAAIIGSEFYVMERLDGLILRRDIPEGAGLDRPASVGALCCAAIDTLTALHTVDLEPTGLRILDRGPGYVVRQITGWSDRFRRARTQDVGDFEGVMAWLSAHRPPDRRHTMIHNDFRFDNLVLDRADPTRIRGVLDWELATVGDPLMDLGSAMAYWAQADDPEPVRAIRLQPTTAPGMWTRDEVWAAYLERRGLTVSAADRRFYDVFGIFRLAGIAQQIYYRAFHGQTTNPKATRMGEVVRVLEGRCRDLLT